MKRGVDSMNEKRNCIITSCKMLNSVKNIFSYAIYFYASLISLILIIVRPIFIIGDLNLAKYGHNSFSLAQIFNKTDEEGKYYKVSVLALYKLVIFLGVILLYLPFYVLASFIENRYFTNNRWNIIIVISVLLILSLYYVNLCLKANNFFSYSFTKEPLSNIFKSAIATSHKNMGKLIGLDILSLLALIVLGVLYFLVCYCMIIRGVWALEIVGVVLLTLLVILTVVYLFPLLHLIRQNKLYAIFLNNYNLFKLQTNVTLTDVKFYNDNLAETFSPEMENKYESIPNFKVETDEPKVTKPDLEEVNEESEHNDNLLLHSND